LRIDDDNKVWIAAPQGGFRQIPAFKYRRKILEQAFVRGVYPSGDKLYQVVMQDYYWPGLHVDCCELAHSSIIR
jgi:hypothetical protein